MVRKREFEYKFAVDLKNFGYVNIRELAKKVNLSLTKRLIMAIILFIDFIPTSFIKLT